MKRKKTNLSKPVTLTLGFVACLVLTLGILLANPTNTANAEAAPPVETLEVAFNRTELGDSLATNFLRTKRQKRSKSPRAQTIRRPLRRSAATDR